MATIGTSTILRCFQLFGIYTFVQSSSKFVHILELLWSFSHICLLTSVVIVTIYNARGIFYMGDLVTALADIIQWAIPITAHFVIIIESLLTRSKRQRFWELLHYVDTKLLTLSPDNVAKTIQVFAIKTFLCHGLALVIEVTIILRIETNKEWRRQWFASIYSMVVCRSQVLLYVFFVDMLSCRMCAIKNDFHHMARFRQSAITSEKFRQLKESLNVIWICLQELNKAFGSSMLLIIVAYFICTCVNMYWNYVSLYFQTNPFLMESLVGSIPPIISLFIIFQVTGYFHKLVS